MNTLLGNNNAATRLKTINNEFLFMKLFDIFSPVTAPSQYCIHKFIRNLELCVIVDDAGHGFEERGKKDEEAVEEMEHREKNESCVTQTTRCSIAQKLSA